VSISRLLVAVSTPWASDKLFATVRDLADRLSASVIVAHVARPTERDATEEDTRQRGMQTLEAMTSKLIAANIPAEGLLLHGDDIARAVLNAADAQNATVIVLGLSGRSLVTRWLAGDVPLQILRQAAVPVLIFPPDFVGTV